MKIAKINEGKSATSKPFNKLSFDSAKQGTVVVEGKTFDQVQFLTGSEIAKTLGGKGLGRAILVDDGNKPLGQCLPFNGEEKEANFNLPAKAGAIEAVPMPAAEKQSFIARLKASSNKSAWEYAAQLEKGADVINVLIHGWKGADFVRA